MRRRLTHANGRPTSQSPNVHAHMCRLSGGRLKRGVRQTGKRDETMSSKNGVRLGLVHLVVVATLAVDPGGFTANDLASTAGLAVSGEIHVIEEPNCTIRVREFANALYTKIKSQLRVPLAARDGEQGAATVHFYVGRKGQVMELTTVRAMGTHSMEVAARKSVLHAQPLPEPGFVDSACERVGVEFEFCYNMDEAARAQWHQNASTQ